MDEIKSLLDVSLNSPVKVFMPGECVTGSVKFEAKNDLKIEQISVFFHGENYFYRGDDELSHVFTTASNPLDFKGAGEGNIQMPFSFLVKQDAPASIATPLGGIRYRVYVSLFYKKLNQSKAQNVDKSEYFTVIVPKQFKNDESGKKESIQERGLLSCCLGYVSADFEIVNTSLVCGHCASINVCVVNTTNSHVLMTSLSLIQKVVRLKDGKIIKNQVATKERGSIMPGNRQVWLADKFIIPPLPPSGSYLYFYVSYCFVLEIQKSMAKTIKVKIPVTVGNIPYNCKTLPSTWNDPTGGIEFWCSAIEESIKNVGFRPLYVSYITT